ncbi:MAG TPA: LLM class F420-dependent oxidoreductase, partial [Verrucomicrobiae bacterium]|nr:LLM class F420-dependent oxidoreductase [Verrucomicrobiae bacterium]
AWYLTMANYLASLRSQGFTEEDVKNGGSDRLVDAIVAWGDMRAIVDRVRAHQSAGADHVCIQVVTAEPRALPLSQWRELASSLIGRN